MAFGGTAFQGVAVPHQPDRRDGVVRRRLLRAVLRWHLRRRRRNPRGAPRDEPALLADRIPVLLGGHRYRPDAAADTDAGQGRNGVRVTASARVLRRDADEHQERAWGELLQIAAAVLAQRPARRPTAWRRNRLARRRSPI